MEKKNVTVKSIGFCGLLTIAFIVLKLCGVITWPWLIVLAPILISLVIKLIALIVICVVGIFLLRD